MMWVFQEDVDGALPGRSWDQSVRRIYRFLGSDRRGDAWGLSEPS
jgi:hypothetical protein